VSHNTVYNVVNGIQLFLAECEMHNNLIFATGRHLALDAMSSITSDFNLFVPNAVIVNVTTYGLDSWNDTSGQDLNSVTTPSANLYTEPPTQATHLRPTVDSDARNSGTPIENITTDFVGNVRDPIMPDIGAWEVP
jgi:hypothetical protein